MNLRTVFHAPAIREKALLTRRFFGEKLLDARIFNARKEQAIFLKIREAKFRLETCRRSYRLNGYPLETEPESVRNTKCGFSPRELHRIEYKRKEQALMHDISFQYIELGKLAGGSKKLAMAYYSKAARLMSDSEQVPLHQNDFNRLECVSMTLECVQRMLSLGAGSQKLKEAEVRLKERHEQLANSIKLNRRFEPMRAGFPPDWKNPGYSWENFEPII